MNICKIVDQVVNDVSLETANGMVNLDDALHVYMVQEKLKQFIDPKLVEKVLHEKKIDDDEMIKYKEKDADGKMQSKEMKASSAKSMEKEHPAKIAYDKLAGEEDTPDSGAANPMYTGDEPGIEPPKGEEAAIQNPDYDPDNADWKPETHYDHKAVEKLANKLNEITGQVPFESDEDKAAFQRCIDSIKNNQSMDPKDAEIFNKYARVKETSGQSNPEFAIYVCNTTPGDFRQGRRNKIEIGSGRSAHSLRKRCEAQGIQASSATTSAGSAPPKVPGKVMTMTKVAQSHGGGVVEHKVEKVRDPGPKISEVRFGNRVLKRIPEPDPDKLIAEKLYSEIMKANDGMGEEEAKKLAEKRIKTIKRNNGMIDQYEKIDTVNEASLVKDADTSTPEGRAKVAKEGPNVMAQALREQMEKAGPLTEDEEKMLKRLESLGDIKDPEEYEKEAMNLLSDMQKVESMRKGVPDVAEAVIMCVMNKQGLDCIAPAGETYKVADLIVFPPEDDPENPNSAEYIVWLESAGGLSVKWKGGAASGARAKIEVTAFKNEDTQQKCTDILDLHNNFMGTKPRGKNSPGNPLDATRIEAGKKELDTREKWAREQGLLSDDDFDENGDMILPGSRPQRTTKQWASDSIADWQAKGSLPPDCTQTLITAGEKCLTDDNKKLLLDSLDQYCRGGIMLQHIHNRDLDYQPYGNANGTANELELSNGIDCVNHMHFQPNPGFDFTQDVNGNHIVRPNAVYAGHLEKKCD